MTSTLLIDIGNSRLKWSLLLQDKLQPVTTLDYRQTAFSANLQDDWSTLPTPEKIALASVGQKEIVETVIKTATKLWPAIKIFNAQTTREQCGVKNAYRMPEKLGIDRWLALIGAHHHYPADSWVVDCGSAITLDYIQHDGKHQGGLIAPGIIMMQQALTTNTANLPPVKQTSVNNLEDFTEAAIYSGTLLAACGLIEKAVKSKNNGQILLTGGDAQLIARHLSVDALVDPELVLKGLTIYSQNTC